MAGGLPDQPADRRGRGQGGGPAHPKTRDFTATGRLDYLGAALPALSLVGVTFTLIEAPGGGSATDVALVAALG